MMKTSSVGPYWARRQQDIRALEVTVDDWLVAILVLILRECVQVVHPTRHIQRRPVRNDAAAILRRMQPRWQRCYIVAAYRPPCTAVPGE